MQAVLLWVATDQLIAALPSGVTGTLVIVVIVVGVVMLLAAQALNMLGGRLGGTVTGWPWTAIPGR